MIIIILKLQYVQYKKINQKQFCEWNLLLLLLKIHLLYNYLSFQLFCVEMIRFLFTHYQHKYAMLSRLLTCF